MSSSYSVVLGTETSWNDSVRSEEVFGNNYNVYRDDRDLTLAQRMSGGGVLIAISSKYNSELIASTKFSEFEHVWVKTHIAGETHIFVSVYFPPDQACKLVYEKFFQNAEEIISQFPPEFKVHVYGDFNQRDADFICDSENECILLPVVGENETLQFIFDKAACLGLNQINHVKNQQNRYLDFLLTNIFDDFCVDESPSPLWKNEAFHTAIEFSIFVHNNHNHNNWEYEDVYDYNNADYDNIRIKLNNTNWQSALKHCEVDCAVEVFYNILMEIIHSEVPLIRKRRNNSSKNPVWFNKQIINLKNRKQKFHKAYRQNKNQENLEKYLSACDHLNLAVSAALEEYNRKTENEVKSCPKRFFNYAKTRLNSSIFPSKMSLDGKVGENSEQICNLFATFFQETYSKFSDADRDFEYFTHFPDLTSDIGVNQILLRDIMTGLKDLDANKGSGPDGIPPRFLKNLATEFAAPLFWLFNKSLETGMFPNEWKKSFLIPIYKSGKKSDVRNYRGIAIISCIPKLFESIINKSVFNQIKHRITNAQHGFFKGRSTTTNLLEFVNYTLAAMDKGNYVESLYTDFSKAFDKLDIPMLIFKLDRLGIELRLLKWIESYLTNRKQIVKFEGKKSHPINVSSGVPQGSHLGPLLFILFVNDISYILKHLKILIYADDMKLFMEITNEKDVDTYLREICIFDQWCNKSLLQLNVKKCNLITFSRKHSIPPITVSLGNQVVVKCDRIRDLGVILDSKLAFTDHYNAIIHKATNMLGFIKRFGYNFKDPYTIKTLYIAYVRSVLEYCSIVWSPYMITHEERIESIQKQFLLYALRNLGWTTFPLPSYKARCLLIDIQTLKERREFAMVSFVNDIVSQRIDSANLLSCINFYAPTRQLRNRNLFALNNHRRDYAKFSPLNRMMSLYNQHCVSIDLTISRTNLRKYFNSLRNNRI